MHALNNKTFESGRTNIDCVCLIEGYSDLRVNVEATEYWAVNIFSEDSGYVKESEMIITEMKVFGTDVTVDEYDIFLLTGVSQIDINETIIGQIYHYLETGDDESLDI